MTIRNNVIGIRGASHVSVPCRDVEFSLGFYEEILGAVVLPGYKLGFTEEEIRAGRKKHIFIEIGHMLVELVEKDEDGHYPPAGVHYAFDIGPNDLDRIQKWLVSKRIPIRGPQTHTGTEAVSIYFLDPDENRLEICCWDGYNDVDKLPLRHGNPPKYEWDPVARIGKAIVE